MMKQELIKRAIAYALNRGIPFFAYKLPNTSECNFGAQIDARFSCDDGFYIHPFFCNDRYQAKTIYQQLNAADFNDICSNTNAHNPGYFNCETIDDCGTCYETYIDSIKNTLDYIKSGIANKIVISRTIVKKHAFDANYWGDLFFRLAAKHPQAFVFVFSSEETGAWIGATPEILGTYSNPIFQTMALAGTRRCTSADIEWSKKDIEEQGYVVDYIKRTIQSSGFCYKISDTFNKNAGIIEHLCNTFTVESDSILKIKSLLNKLHPTPALAGLPKDVAINCIRKTEKHDREYYGGYIGPFTATEFNYFVNLRSMKFDSQKFKLYVGGGIVKGSIPEEEWIETDNKSQTLLSCM